MPRYGSFQIENTAVSARSGNIDMMNPFFRGAIVMVCAASLTACARVVRGTTEDIVINYSPIDATETTSLNHTCTANPCTVKVKLKEEFSVTASKPGYQSQTIQVSTKLSKGGAAGLAGNVVVGSVTGLGVDAASGATLDHYPNPVVIRLLRNGEAAPEVIPAPPAKRKKRMVPMS